MELASVVGFLVIGFLLGKFWERWSSGNIDIQDEAYRAGFRAGLESNEWPDRTGSI